MDLVGIIIDLATEFLLELLLPKHSAVRPIIFWWKYLDLIARSSGTNNVASGVHKAQCFFKKLGIATIVDYWGGGGGGGGIYSLF